MTHEDANPAPVEVAETSTETGTGSRTGRSGGMIAILLAATFVVILNETVVNVAIARIMNDLGVDETVAQWLTTAFLLTMAVVIPMTGWLLERLSTRTVFVLAMSLFVTGTLTAAVAPVFQVLLAGRIVQASGTAIMLPLLMTSIMSLVGPERRGRIMGFVSMVIAVAPAFGPSISGLILSFASWRWIFVFILPIAVTMLVIGALRVRNVGEHRATRLDVPSVVLATAGFGGLVYGLSIIGSAAAPVWALPTALGIGAVALATFIARQLRLQRREAALLDLRVFEHGSFTLGLVIMAFGMLCMFGVVIVLPLLLQRAFGADPLLVGLMLLPGGVVMGVLGPIVGRIMDAHGPAPLVRPGALLVAASFVVLATMRLDSPVWLVVVAHVLLSCGLALIFTPMFTISLGSLTPHLYSHGSAVLGTSQQLAGAAGTATFIAIMSLASGAAAGAAPEAEELMRGAHTSFLAAGLAWLVPTVLVWFVRRPRPAAEGVAAHDSQSPGSDR